MSAKKSLCVLPLLWLVFGACSSTSVDVSYDPDFDFSKTRTFDFLEAKAGAQTVVKEVGLLGVVEKAIAARGLQRTKENPDVLVAVHRTVEGSLNTQHSGYEVRSGRVARYTLQEATLVVDVVSAARRESIWRGTATGAFRDDLSPAEREKLVMDLLGEMFADFPPGR
jgi:hypothetical protein